MSEEHYKNKAEYLDKRELELLAEIKELKKQLAFMEGEYPEPTIAAKIKEFANLEQALNRIAELEKDGKVCATCGGLVYDAVLPQTKPLSDEEIEQFAKRKANQILMDLLMPDVGEPKKIDWNIGCTNQHLVNFARAIEERHGIK